MSQKQPNSVWGSLKALDAFPKVNEDFFQRTMSGGIITIVASVFMFILFMSEVRLFLTTQTSHELTVDTSRGETITIHFDIEFTKMPCSWLSVDAMDISGDMHLDVDHDMYKQRLSTTGQKIAEAVKHDVAATKVEPKKDTNATCGSCYGAEDASQPCCNTCDEVRESYQRKGWVMTNLNDVDQCKHDSYLSAIKEQEGEGCHLWGNLQVNKVAGNFHIAAGRSYQRGSMHIHDMAPFGDKPLDFSHKVNSMSFGKEYPGMKNPLDRSSSSTLLQKILADNKSSSSSGTSVGNEKGTGNKKPSDPTVGMYQYFLKVVPTVYTNIRNETLHTNQFSVTENFRESGDTSGGGRNLPGVFFFYDMSPIKVRIVEQHSSFLHFLTNVCAIVGGVFAVSGLVDAGVHQGEILLRKKMEIGKHY